MYVLHILLIPCGTLCNRKMEVLLVFEQSRRVLVVGEGSSLLAAIERDITERYPDRDLAIAPVGNKVPGSVSKEVYILQKHTEKWGLLDVTDITQINSGDEITLTKVGRKVEPCSPVSSIIFNEKMVTIPNCKERKKLIKQVRKNKHRKTLKCITLCGAQETSLVSNTLLGGL